MKKILLILLCLISCGCFDYTEVSNLSIISAVGIDYDEDYQVTLEILNANSTEETSNSSSYTISANGSTLSEAFNNASLKLENDAYYSHLKVIIISENIAINKLEEVTNYLLRQPEFFNEFYLLISQQNASDILTSNNNSTVVGKQLSNLLENNTYLNKIVKKTFIDAVEVNESSFLPTISLENDEILIKGISLIKMQKLEAYFDMDETYIYSLLNNNDIEYQLVNDSKTILLDKNSTIITINDNKVYITSNLTGEMIEGVYETDTQNDYEELLKQKYQNIINTLIDLNIDILGISEMYYNKYQIDTDWRELEFVIDVSIKINNDLYEVS